MPQVSHYLLILTLHFRASVANINPIHERALRAVNLELNRAEIIYQ